MIEKGNENLYKKQRRKVHFPRVFARTRYKNLYYSFKVFGRYFAIKLS